MSSNFHPVVKSFTTWSLLSLVLFTSACSDSNQGAAPMQDAMPPVTVGVKTITPQAVTIDTLLPGRVTPIKHAEIRPLVSGILTEQLFTEGQVVERGQALYTIDPRRYRVALQQAQASQSQAEAVAHNAATRFQRAQELRKQNLTSQQDFDQAQAEHLAAQAQLAEAQAAVAEAQLNISYTTVKAPITGHIGRSEITVGALVQAGQAQVLARINQLDPIYVDLRQSSTDYSTLQQQLRSGAVLALDPAQDNVALTNAGTTYATGKLLFNELSVDEQTSSVILRAQFENTENQLLPGMYVNATVQTGIIPDALLVPHQAVTRDPRGRATCLVVNEQNQVETRYLEVNSSIGANWLVTDGIQAGDKVIVEGLQKVQPQATVQAEEIK